MTKKTVPTPEEESAALAAEEQGVKEGVSQFPALEPVPGDNLPEAGTVGELPTELNLGDGDKPGELPEGDEIPADSTGPEPDAPKKRKNVAKTADEPGTPPASTEPGQEEQSGESSKNPTEPESSDDAVEEAKKHRRAKVHALEGSEITLTASAQRREDLIDMAESYKSKRILTGVIQGVERSRENPDLVFAVLYHGAFKVIIPAEQLITPDPDMPDAVRGGMVMHRLGAEIDYLVVGIDTQNNIAAGSRIDAMARQRRDYFFQQDRDGNYPIAEGDKAEGRVVSVIRSGLFVELFGVEEYVPLSELTYLRWVDATQHYYPGDKILVKILELTRGPGRKVSLRLSVKQANEDKMLSALRRFVPGNLYSGSVSMITASGIFVSFDDVACLCQFPRRGRPRIGAQVTVRIIGVNLEERQLWGVIIH